MTDADGWSRAGGRRRVPSEGGQPAEEFDTFVIARQRTLVGFAMLLTGNAYDAEDLVQTVLGMAYLRWSRVSASANPDAYVRRMLINQHKSFWRRMWRRRERSVGTLPDVAAAPENAVDMTRQLVLKLPPRQRATVALRYYDDLSERETAEILGCSVGTVKSQTAKALANLRRAIEEEEGEEGVSDGTGK